METEYVYVEYPTSIYELAEEIKMLMNDYKSRQITKEKLHSVIENYAKNVPDKMFKDGDYNSTFKKLVGIRRVEKIDYILNQMKITLSE